MPLARELIRQLAHLLVDIRVQPSDLTVSLGPVPTDVEFLYPHHAPETIQHFVEEVGVVVCHESLR